MSVRRARRRGFAALATSFVAGAAAMAIVWGFWSQRSHSLDDDCGEPAADVRPDSARTPPAPPVVESIVPADRPVRVSGDPLADLRSRRLTIPVEGIEASDLAGSFDDERSGGRRHEAMDILAPRNTPVLAVEDGRIARLFESKAGGLTIYQFDPTATYAYYYAHLERYAKGLTDGDRVRRGQVIGYVGTTGNAPPGTPHLHFAVFKLTDQKRWWDGSAIDPFLVLR
jgi:murein DD-endopeptidase MepM/ murein hydrolase activator NlpD